VHYTHWSNDMFTPPQYVRDLTRLEVASELYSHRRFSPANLLGTSGNWRRFRAAVKSGVLDDSINSTISVQTDLDVAVAAVAVAAAAVAH
jgi:hypothetical protein